RLRRGAEARPDAEGNRRRVHHTGREKQDGRVPSHQDGYCRRQVLRSAAGPQARRSGRHGSVQLGPEHCRRRRREDRQQARQEVSQLLESAKIAIATIWASKLRSLMTVLGNIVAVTSIIAVVSLIQGLNASVKEAIQSEAGTDSFVVQRYPVTRTDEDFD